MQFSALPKTFLLQAEIPHLERKRVYIAAKFYPSYDHHRQFCSELGASGSPTEKLSPRINNYPLSILFCLFGWHIMQLANANMAITLAGFLIVIHGLGTWVAGFFPMDKDPYTQNPSFACKVHSWAGFIMLLSLVIAPLCLIFSPVSDYAPIWFRVLSAFIVCSAIWYLIKMSKAFKNRSSQVGKYQRISYWLKLIWLSVFSLLLVSAN